MWNITDYAMTGRGHVRNGIPCQDKVAAYRKGEVFVIALADGAGSARLSHYGAEAVVDCISRHVGDHFDEYFTASDIDAVKDKIIELVHETLDAVCSAHACGIKDLASTLLLAATKGTKFMILHLGDGVIGYLKQGEVSVATRPDNGAYANETVFTTSTSAARRMRFLKGTDENISGFVLMSDGTESALYDKRQSSLSPAIGRIMQMTANCKAECVRTMLDEAFRETMPAVTQDDCSISIMVDSNAFPKFHEMSTEEKLDLLQVESTGRYTGRRVRHAEMILTAAAEGVSVAAIARILHLKEKYARRKAEELVTLGLLDKENGIYHSCFCNTSADEEAGATYSDERKGDRTARVWKEEQDNALNDTQEDTQNEEMPKVTAETIGKEARYIFVMRQIETMIKEVVEKLSTLVEKNLKKVTE